MVATPKPLSLTQIARNTRSSAQQLAVLCETERNRALEAIAQSLETHTSEILAANEADCQAAKAEGIPQALYARLQLGESKLKAAIAGVRDVAKLPDPIGSVQIHRELDEGLMLKRVTCPLGVLGIIFEARPEALIQITSLAIKSGNGVILKGGKEATRSCQTLTKAIREALTSTKVDPEAVQLLVTREEIRALLELDDYVDLIIPRGSNSFVRYVQDNTRIPVLGHADGICHLYIDAEANLEQAISITVDAKTQYPAACNAIETLLVGSSIAPHFLPKLAAAMPEVELRGDERTLEFLAIKTATAEDWLTEYSDLVLALKIVDSVEDAIA
ncbi:MAG: glutamate-5-semialdehyde dehydrogenase, partial [Cyanobacteriota bacterium]|nr:glutamate-5-semialdehyde dehydrogenase [Cyanobacteriota bacterium]